MMQTYVLRFIKQNILFFIFYFFFNYLIFIFASPQGTIIVRLTLKNKQ